MDITFKGLNIGDGSNFVVTNVVGWESRPEITNGSSPFPNRLGSYLGTLSSVKRVVTIDLVILGDVQNNTLTTGPKRALSQVMNLDDDESPLMIDLGYGAEPELINARVTAYDVVTAKGYGRQATASIEFTAADPRRYSLKLNKSVTGLPVATRGVAYPVQYGRFNGLITPSNRGEAIIENIGNSKTPAVYTLVGPVKNPHITLNNGKGKLTRTQFNVNLASGETLIADTNTGDVTVGGAQRLGIITGALIQDLELPAGISTVTLGGTGSSAAARLTISYRDANL